MRIRKLTIDLMEDDVWTLIEVLDCWAEVLEPEGVCVASHVKKLNDLEAKLRAILEEGK
jgi:hypothetical protein